MLLIRPHFANRFILMFALCLLISSCQLSREVQLTTTAIRENREAILLSNQTIQENNQLIEDSAQTMRENNQIFQDTVASIQKIQQALEKTSSAVQENMSTIEQSTDLISENSLAVEKSTSIIKVYTGAMQLFIDVVENWMPPPLTVVFFTVGCVLVAVCFLSLFLFFWYRKR